MTTQILFQNLQNFSNLKIFQTTFVLMATTVVEHFVAAELDTRFDSKLRILKINAPP